MRFFPLLLASLLLAACSTMAPPQHYRAAGAREALEISGELFDFTNVKIFVDGVKVIDERLSLMSGDGEFRGVYNGRRISASCTTSMGLVASAVRCLVFVDNERAATLSF